MRFQNKLPGSYKLQLTNSAGQIIYTGEVDVAGADIIKTVLLKKVLVAGIYELIVIGESGGEKCGEVGSGIDLLNRKDRKERRSTKKTKLPLTLYQPQCSSVVIVFLNHKDRKEQRSTKRTPRSSVLTSVVLCGNYFFNHRGIGVCSELHEVFLRARRGKLLPAICPLSTVLCQLSSSVFSVILALSVRNFFLDNCPLSTSSRG